MADEGLYMSANDYSDWQTLRTRPSEFFNSIDGEVYKIDTVKYNEIDDKYLSIITGVILAIAAAISGYLAKYFGRR